MSNTTFVKFQNDNNILGKGPYRIIMTYYHHKAAGTLLGSHIWWCLWGKGGFSIYFSAFADKMNWVVSSDWSGFSGAGGFVAGFAVSTSLSILKNLEIGQTFKRTMTMTEKCGHFCSVLRTPLFTDYIQIVSPPKVCGFDLLGILQPPLSPSLWISQSNWLD